MAPDAFCTRGSMLRYAGGEPLRRMRQAMVVVLTTPNSNHPGLSDNFFRGIVSLHCSMLVARVNLTELPLVALTVGDLPGDTARQIASLPGVIHLQSSSLLEWRTLLCVGIGYDAAPGWNASAANVNSVPPPIDAVSHLRAMAFQKLLAWSLHSWVDRAMVVDVDVVMTSTAWPLVRAHMVGQITPDGIAMPDYLTLHGVDFAAGPGFPFNSGVMLIRPSMRTMRALAMLVVQGGYEHSVGVGKTGGDQDLLQAYFAGSFKWRPNRDLSKIVQNTTVVAPKGTAISLPRDFNVRTFHAIHKPKDAQIIHFIGYPKPWSIIDMPGMLTADGDLQRPTLSHYHKLYGNSSRATDPRMSPQWALDLFHDINRQCKILLATKTLAELRGGAAALPFPERSVGQPEANTYDVRRAEKVRGKGHARTARHKSVEAYQGNSGARTGDCSVSSFMEPEDVGPFDTREMAELDALIQLMPSGQQTRTDRELVMRALAARGRHANLLVFGCGRDSAFWAHTMNRYGTTVFLEDVTQWAHLWTNLTVHVVKYATAPLSKWSSRLARPADLGGARALKMEDVRDLAISGVPGGLFEQWWDIVLVDAPAGFNGRMPGRMAPIYQASRILARQREEDPCKPVDVFVHDFSRPVEREWSLMFLTPHARLLNYADLVTQDHMRTTHFQNATFLAWFRSP